MKNTIISSIVKAEDIIISLVFTPLCHTRKEEDK